MKTLLFILIRLSFLTACSKETGTSANLVGTWHNVQHVVLSSKNGAVIKSTDITTYQNKRTLTFNEDGSFTSSIYKLDNEGIATAYPVFNGVYDYNAATSTINITGQYNNSDEITEINYTNNIKLTEHTLIISSTYNHDLDNDGNLEVLKAMYTK